MFLFWFNKKGDWTRKSNGFTGVLPKVNDSPTVDYTYLELLLYTLWVFDNLDIGFFFRVARGGRDVMEGMSTGETESWGGVNPLLFFFALFYFFWLNSERRQSNCHLERKSSSSPQPRAYPKHCREKINY